MIAHAEAPPRILVVDDNPANRALVESTLDEEGCVVVLASSGEQALAAFEAEPFDCVLLDVKMPGMDGLEVCRRLRAHERGAHVPVVFLTALRDVDTFDEAQRAGGDDFLVKPVRPTELIVRTQAALKLKRLASENRGYYQIIREQRDALMRLQLQKEQLSAFVVHDLKNPVSALDLHAQLILRDRSLSERAHNSARAIREEARLLMRLIQNLLDISRSEAGELAPRFHDVDLRALAESVRESIEPQAVKKEVSLALQVEASSVRADLDLLRRVLENLLENAVRHAPPGTEVVLSARPSDDHVELRVRDQGRGVPESMRERVFERFAQLGSSGANRTGYGLGLAFCKLAVEQQGGEIWVEDAAPGAAFCVRLRHGD